MITANKIIKDIKKAKQKHGANCFTEYSVDRLINIESIFSKLVKIEDSQKVINILTDLYNADANGCYIIDELYKQYSNHEAEHEDIVLFLKKNLT
jgi:hypothetical protein